MDIEILKNRVRSIVEKASALKSRHTDDTTAQVNYACIFSQGKEEYDELILLTQKIGRVLKETPTGLLFQIESLQTVSGPLQLLKIRIPDLTRPELGDADFTIRNFHEFEKKYLSQPEFKRIEREDFYMVELMEPGCDVRAYFSNPPLDDQMGIKNEIDHLAQTIWGYMLMHQELRPMDTIFALGSHDISVAERAADLYLQGYGKYLIIAGGKGRVTREDWQIAEAEVFVGIAIAKGVPRDKIIIEDKSSNTGENISFVKKILQERGLEFKSLLLVNKPYMERRTFATFRKQWPEVECIVTSPQISFAEYGEDENYKKKYISIMVGDLLRIREYPKLGFQIEQDIPDEVWGAGQRLLELGFDKYRL